MDSPMNNASNCPDLMTRLPYEVSVGYESHLTWLRGIHWLAMLSVPAYLLAIATGQRFMRDRKPVSLKWPLFAWNLSLAVFSFIGAARLTQEFSHVLTTYDVYSSVCITGPCSVRGFWISAFALSKILELGDTFFLIARKKPVIFLHWYHHVSVLLFTWVSAVEAASFGRYFMGINFVIHALMYSYFAVQSLGHRLPRHVSMAITTLQIVQMVAGIFVVAYADSMIRNGAYCEVKRQTITIALVIYASYFVLFVRFFYQAYLSSGRRAAAAAVEKKRLLEMAVTAEGTPSPATETTPSLASPSDTTSASTTSTGITTTAGKKGKDSRLDRNQNYVHSHKKEL